MPPGYYLAQGLIPLGPSSSEMNEDIDSEASDGYESEDPDYHSDDSGPLTCPHGLVVCGLCCVDYSFMDEIERDETENRGELEELATPLRKGSGRVFPTRFTPPSSSVRPAELFTGRSRGLFKRYTLPDDPGTFVIYTDGCCLNNGQPDPRAGWAFWHGDFADGEPAIASGRLEQKGPFGDDATQTSNRAELRAVIAALRFQPWHDMRTMVVATDSKIAVEGATKWAKKWVKDGWKRREPRGVRSDVKNRDLWEALLGEIERCKEAGTDVQFWRIPREWNEKADAAAKEAAAGSDAPAEWDEGDD